MAFLDNSLGLNRGYNGTAVLPEIAAAGNFNAGGQQAGQPPAAPPNLNLVKPVAMPTDVNDPTVPPELPPEAAQVPAAPAIAPAAASVAPNLLPSERVQWKNNPLAAIGLVLSNVAAGMRGQPLPTDRLAQQDIEAQALAYKQASFGLDVVDKYTQILGNTPAEQRAGVINHADQIFGKMVPSLKPLLTAVSSGQIKNAEQKLAAGKALGIITPQTIGAVTDADGNINIPLLDTFLGMGLKIKEAGDSAQASRETPGAAAIRAGDIETAQQKAKPETFTDRAQSGINPATGNPEMFQLGSKGTIQWKGIAPVEKVTPPSGYRYAADGKSLEPIPGGPVAGKDFSNPVTIEIDDGKGGTKQLLAQQDKSTGGWFTADEKRTPIDATDIHVVSNAGGYGGARSQVQMLRMLSSAHTLANELENVSALPSTATTGWFGGAQQGGGLKDAVQAVLAREVNPQEVQSAQVATAGLTRAISQMEAAGLAPPGQMTAQLNLLNLNKADTEFTRLQKLATLRQTGEGILDSVANSPVATKKQLDEISGLKARLAKAIPFLPIDVINLAKSKNPHATIADMAKARGLGGSNSGTAGTTQSGVGFRILGQ